MAPRASWKGFINLSLVSVPVKAYSATNTSSTIRLNQLCSECNSRIKQKLTCPTCGDVERSQIVKGYEYAKDQYVVIDLDELEKLRADDEGKAVKINCFVPASEIDPLQMSDSSYYLVPDGAAGQKPFALIHRALQEKELYCIGRIVMHNKEQLVLIRALENLLCMTTLRYAGQLKSTSSFDDELAESAVSDAEYDLAMTLIDETTVQEIDLNQFKDQYTENLTQLIEAKVSGQEIVEAPSAETPSVINLMDALRASVAKAQETREAESPLSTGGARKAAAPARTKKKSAKKKPSAARKALASELSEPRKSKRKTAKKSKTG